jgi:hypothetical protein
VLLIVAVRVHCVRASCSDFKCDVEVVIVALLHNCVKHNIEEVRNVGLDLLVRAVRATRSR